MNQSESHDGAPDALARGDIAVVGMSCLFPGAPDLHAYWRNIVTGFDAVTDVPPGRWETDPFYDPSSSDDDRIYTKRGGYLPTHIPFKPLEYGIMPVAVAGGEVDQFLVLKLVHDALIDAGYAGGLAESEKTSFVLGRGNYLGPGNSNLFQRSIGIEQALRILKAVHPEHTEAELEAMRRDLRASLPPFGPELGPTHIPNVVTGRSANRLDFMGSNFTVDAACASSLIALETAVENLLTGKTDLAIAGGSHTFTCVPLLMVFSTLNALSRSSTIQPFSAGADGTLPGEGIGIVILKRLADAQRDGNRIYAVIKGVGSASDGRAISVMAPRVEGEVLALRRAYARAGVEPHSVGLIEGHGTATAVGDAAEVQALRTVFGPRQGDTPHIGLGAVKSMIGHTMPASGIAGLIKTALALYHKTLPPTLHCDTPHPKLELEASPFYINTETRPWINAGMEAPRRAGVNAFGFGGINAHVVLEEAPAQSETSPDVVPWPTELFLVGAATREALVAQLERLRAYLDARPDVDPADLAFTLSRRFDQPACRLCIVAATLEELHNRLARAHKLLSDPACQQIKDPRGIYFFTQPLAGRGKIAFLFPGEGSQRINMLSELCLHFPEVRAVFDAADRNILAQGRNDLISADVFPPPCRTAQEREQAEERLWRLDRQCECLMTASRAMFVLFGHLGINADMIVGHSIGEWSSLIGGGVIAADTPVDALRSLEDMALAIEWDPSIPQAALLAVATNRTVAESIIAGLDDTYVALDNCPHQVVIATSEEMAEQVTARLRNHGLGYERSRFNRGSHTPLFAGFTALARRHFAAIDVQPAHLDVYSCCTAAPLPRDADAIRAMLVRSWESPVEYQRTIEAMYEAGARIFIETGPRNVLSAFTDDILRGKNALALAVDLPRWTELTGVNHLVAMLTAHGYNLNIPYLFARRSLRELALDPQQDDPAARTGEQGVIMLNLSIPMMTLSEDTLSALRQEHHSAVLAPMTAPPAPAPAPIAPLSADAPAREREARVADPVAAGAIMGSATTPTPTPPAGTPSYAAIAPVVAAPQPVAERPPAAVARRWPSAAPPQQARTEAPMGVRNDGVIAHFMESMGRFLQAEQRVLETYLHGQPPRGARLPARSGYRWPMPPSYAVPSSPLTAPLAGPDDQSGPLALAGEILSLVPGQSLVARRRVDPDEDLYLHDHTFGGRMSILDPTLEPLMVAPLTISLEVMAQAAAQLLPDLLLIGMADVRAHRWVQVDESAPTILEISAQREGSEQQVRVEVREVGADGMPDAMLIEGTMVFGAAYEPAPAPEAFVPAHPVQTVKTARQMYDEMWMFHGPRFQGVASLDLSGEDGIIGQLEVMPTHNLFRSTDHPRLLTDVALLDAAGQLLGYWAKERLASSFVVFPIRLAALRLFGPNLPAGTRVYCNVRLTEIMEQTVKVTMEVLDPRGALWMRIEGWQDWRFNITGAVYDFWRFPIPHLLSKPLSAPIPQGMEQGAFACYHMGTLTVLGQTMISKSVAYMVLNHAERRVYHGLRGPTARQVEWLAGRIAAKDAVRAYVLQRYGLQVPAGDIEIASDEHGRPTVQGAWLRQIPTVPGISLAHADGKAVAIAGDIARVVGLGIDVQGISARPPEFDEIAFAPDEPALAQASAGPARDELRMRLWCAKEAIAKALGRGLLQGPRAVAIEEWNDRTGVALAGLRGALAAEFPHLAGKKLIAYTTRTGDHIVATSFGETV